MSLFLTDTSDKEVGLLGAIFKALLEVLRRQCEDHLGDGKYADVAAFDEYTLSCSANNISGERVFAKHDASIHRAPSAAADYHESKVTFSINQTGKWLGFLPPIIRSKVMKLARHSQRRIRASCKENTKSVHERRRALLKAKEEKLVAKQEKDRLRKEDLLGELFHIGGLWQIAEPDDVMELMIQEHK